MSGVDVFLGLIEVRADFAEFGENLGRRLVVDGRVDAHPHIHMRLHVEGRRDALGHLERGVAERRLRDDLENAVTLLAYAGCITLGVATAVALAPGGEPRSIAVQSALAGGLGIGLLSAQRARPSPTQWALGMGVLGIVAAWQRLG